MKVRILAAFVILACLASGAFAFIGPSTAGLSQGKWSIGANYDYSSQDLDKETIKYTYSWVDYLPDGTVDDEGSGSGSYKLEVRNLNVNRYYGKLGYGVNDQLEVYAQLGIADVKAETKEVEDDQWYGYNLDNELAYGLGVKYTFYKQDKIDWGAGVQLNWYSNSIDEKGIDDYNDGEGYTEIDTWKDTTKIDTLGIIVTVGPTIDMGGWKLYGGALLSYLSADYEWKEKGSWVGSDDYYGTWNDKDSGTYKQTSFGGYVGVQCSIYENWSLAAELMGTTDGWGAGAGIDIPF